VILPRPSRATAWAKAARRKNITHQQKKLTTRTIKAFRDRFNIRSRRQLATSRSTSRPKDSAGDAKYLHERAQALGGYLPQRRTQGRRALAGAAADRVRALLEGHRRGREISTTMAFVRILTLLRDKAIGRASCRSCPTRRAPSAWKACSARSASTTSGPALHAGRQADQLMYYREDKDGQILQEGINEAGAMSSGSPRRRRTAPTTAS
jgi:pyruvate dehydrogenase E1 component